MLYLCSADSLNELSVYDTDDDTEEQVSLARLQHCVNIGIEIVGVDFKVKSGFDVYCTLREHRMISGVWLKSRTSWSVRGCVAYRFNDNILTRMQILRSFGGQLVVDIAEICSGLGAGCFSMLKYNLSIVNIVLVLTDDVEFSDATLYGAIGNPGVFYDIRRLSLEYADKFYSAVYYQYEFSIGMAFKQIVDDSSRKAKFRVLLQRG